MNNEKEFCARVLVAEDDPINLDIASRALQKLGCEVVAADNGAIATLLLALEDFDLILMDCEMPQIDGIEATRLVREVESLRAAQQQNGPARRTPVIAVTAHSSDDVRDRCLAAGMDDFISKPFTRNQLTLLLRRWLGERAAPSACVCTEDQAAPAPKSQQNGPIDTAVLNALCVSKDSDGTPYLGKLLIRFEEIARGQLSTMWEKVRNGQKEDLWRIAHTLKSSAGALGAAKLASQAGLIEHRAKEQGTVGLEPALSQLENDFGEAIAALSEFARGFNAPLQR